VIAIAEAVATLQSGGLVVYPTESVYGIGTALSAGAAGVERVRQAKGSAKGRPFLLLAADRKMAFGLWSEVPDAARALAERAWPAPLTLIGPARADLLPELLGESPEGVPTVAVRVPSDPWLLALLEALGEPLLSTSANRAGGDPPKTFSEIRLGALAPDLAIDRGSCEWGVPSTLVSCLEPNPVILRQGAYILEDEGRNSESE
jgi:L-threonylcarbamoyladenylate synthase